MELKSQTSQVLYALKRVLSTLMNTLPNDTQSNNRRRTHRIKHSGVRLAGVRRSNIGTKQARRGSTIDLLLVMGLLALCCGGLAGGGGITRRRSPATDAVLHTLVQGLFEIVYLQPQLQTSVISVISGVVRFT